MGDVLGAAAQTAQRSSRLDDVLHDELHLTGVRLDLDLHWSPPVRRGGPEQATVLVASGRQFQERLAGGRATFLRERSAKKLT